MSVEWSMGEARLAVSTYAVVLGATPELAHDVANRLCRRHDYIPARLPELVVEELARLRLEQPVVDEEPGAPYSYPGSSS